jgi:multidrug efflux pump subunit AcrB
MLVDYTNQRRAAGDNQNGFDSANHARLRPILMTTIAMVFGIPYCISGWSRCRMEKRIGMGNHWWFDKFTIPYADYCSGNL